MRHGVFVYEIDPLWTRYGGARGIAAEAKRMRFDHIWMRLHGRAGLTDGVMRRLEATRVLQAEGVSVLGWGWNQGPDVAREIGLVRQALETYSTVEGYVADLEGDGTVNRSVWTWSQVKEFFRGLRGLLGEYARASRAMALGLSSFGWMAYHKPEVHGAAAEFCDFGAPQVYWFDHPSERMIEEARGGAHTETQRHRGMELVAHDPATYAGLCCEQWGAMGFKKLYVTGQAYWGESGFSQAEAEGKLRAFCARWRPVCAASGASPEVEGLNWWHWGGAGCAAWSEGMAGMILEAVKRWQAGEEEELAQRRGGAEESRSIVAGALRTLKSLAERQANQSEELAGALAAVMARLKEIGQD